MASKPKFSAEQYNQMNDEQIDRLVQEEVDLSNAILESELCELGIEEGDEINEEVQMSGEEDEDTDDPCT